MLDVGCSMFDKKDHPCPLLEGRRGTRRVRLHGKEKHTSLTPISAAQGYGSPPFCKEGPGVVSSNIKHRASNIEHPTSSIALIPLFSAPIQYKPLNIFL
jgi:hypothetical protein